MITFKSLSLGLWHFVFVKCRGVTVQKQDSVHSCIIPFPVTFHEISASRSLPFNFPKQVFIFEVAGSSK